MATTATDYEKEMFSGVSSASVHAATGRTWDEWLEVLDAAQALQLDHKGIVAHLEREYPEVSAWWQQSIAVGYERARGIRVVGQTADAGFQVGVQRSVAAPKPAVWELVVSHPELWLGDAAQVVLAEGTRYELPGSGDASGVRGEIRVVRPEQRLRLTWQPSEWAMPAVLQLTLSVSSSGKTGMGFHLEKLPDVEAREAMRTHWREVLDRLAAAID